jgi:hypothetical protein
VVLASTGYEEYTLVEFPVTVTCRLAFEDENDATEQRWDERARGDCCSMPLDGGEVILLLGRMEVWDPEGLCSRDDMYLIMGRLAHWGDTHNGD